LAQRINERYEIEQKVSGYILLRGFLEKKSLPLLIVLAILLRVLLGIGSYSGEGDFPNLGDFEAHRNWMSITVNRPIQSWYQEYDLQPWWRIDYPPIAAYLSYIFGMFYRHIEP
jgi:alpha-1,3-glucosyltransferase